MRWFATILLLTGCGRIGFDEIDPTSPAAHDEDGDGVPDLIDVCPHLPGSQADSDGDGVGDDCDFEPTVPRQRIALFATMRPGDQPFTLAATGAWVQLDDAIHYEGGQDARLSYDLSMQDVRIAMGIDILDVSGSAAIQHQLSLSANVGTNLAHEFVELNEVDPNKNAAVTLYNGTTYVVMASQTLPSGVHPGSVLLQATELVGTSVTMDGGWPGELYHLVHPTTVYQGASSVQFIANALVIDVRWIIIIATS
jgi:hypothetical protein